MGMIIVPEHRPEDIEAWRRYEIEDRAWASTERFASRVLRALDALRRFVRDRRAYVSVSWGKDSVVVAHLAWLMRELGGPRLTICHVRCVPIAAPHLDLVRDQFLTRYDMPYDEVTVRARRGRDGEWHATGTLEEGLRGFGARYGRDYVTGIRADESADRRRRDRSWGEISPHTCAPISSWSGRDVYAYLAEHDLPIHPTYAMSYGGRISRERLRVSSITLHRGDGHGRAEWERTYYGWRLDEIRELSEKSFGA